MWLPKKNRREVIYLTKDGVAAHAVVPDAARHPEVLERAHAAIAPFGIGHITMQLERASRQHLEGHQHA